MRKDEISEPCLLHAHIAVGKVQPHNMVGRDPEMLSGKCLLTSANFCHAGLFAIRVLSIGHCGERHGNATLPLRSEKVPKPKGEPNVRLCRKPKL